MAPCRRTTPGRRKPNRRDPIGEALRKLESALAPRCNHARWCGLTTHTTPFGLIQVQWVDELEHTRGTIGVFAPRDRSTCHAVIAAALERVREWKQGAEPAR